MIVIKLLFILILTLAFIIFSFSSKLKIFQKLMIIIGYAIVSIFIIFPSYSDKVANLVSLESGTDLIVYIVLALTSLVNLILYVGQKDTKYISTKIIRENAKQNARKY